MKPGKPFLRTANRRKNIKISKMFHLKRVDTCEKVQNMLIDSCGTLGKSRGKVWEFCV